MKQRQVLSIVKIRKIFKYEEIEGQIDLSLRANFFFGFYIKNSSAEISQDKTFCICHTERVLKAIDKKSFWMLYKVEPDQ